MQHRQIEARAVPGHEIRRVLVEPSKKRSIKSFSGELSSPRLHTLRVSRERITTEIATTRCCSCDRNSLPVSWRRLVNMICATCSSDSSWRP